MMYTITAILYQRSLARDAFRSLHMKALVARIRAKLLGIKNCLKDFAEQKDNIYLTPINMGVQDILIDQIVGSVGRSDDFDNQFRPLKDHLRERWVNVYLRLPVDDLPAIHVFKVGDQYYVEDGHHRVSTARYSGRKYIQAEVWQYSQRIPSCLCASANKLESRSVSC